MPEGSWREEMFPMVRTLQIVVSALAIGPVSFLAIAGALVAQGTFDAQDDTLFFPLNLVLVLFLAGVSISRDIVPGLIVSQSRRKISAGQWQSPKGPSGLDLRAPLIERTGDAGRLMSVFQTKTIVAAALLEGLAFFATIVFMLTQSMIALAVAVVMILGVMLHFPTHSGVAHWIEDQLALIEQERLFRS